MPSDEHVRAFDTASRKRDSASRLSSHDGTASSGLSSSRRAQAARWAPHFGQDRSLEQAGFRVALLAVHLEHQVT
eukprot:CAMPEP_0205901392 /NCGR_PEP_ID=MMETSP1083-20121108/27657_1 /ASSEMBLY_ACC=CAM_ASM_000430 /TAXON_ID=97485 /ORGANISM="Prymnesium parvum, Strain Texoma1" /LENGTH=74 /DNA_ID=CAMNT_0053266917 /DNA_START=297 /DNA_END=517 /DNA_ORIENTATION=+